MLLNHGPLPESLQVAEMESLPGTLTIMGVATVPPPVVSTAYVSQVHHPL